MELVIIHLNLATKISLFTLIFEWIFRIFTEWPLILSVLAVLLLFIEDSDLLNFWRSSRYKRYNLFNNGR